MFERPRIAMAAIALLGTVGLASAQTIIIEPEDEVIIRDYVVEQPQREVTVPDDYDVVVGEELPDTVVVSPLDAPGLEREYEYVVIDGQTVLVEPGTRRVVQVLN